MDEAPLQKDAPGSCPSIEIANNTSAAAAVRRSDSISQNICHGGLDLPRGDMEELRSDADPGDAEGGQVLPLELRRRLAGTREPQG